MSAIVEGTGRYGTIVESATQWLGISSSPVTIPSIVTGLLGRFSADYDVDAIARAIADRIEAALPQGYSIHGDELAIAPYSPALTDADRQAAQEAWPQGDDFDAICEARPAGHAPQRRLRVAWTASYDVLVDVGTPEERATDICSCIIEQWDEDGGDWVGADDERVHAAYARLREGDDWSLPEPFEEARSRLLARAGLTEDDITDSDAECW